MRFALLFAANLLLLGKAIGPQPGPQEACLRVLNLLACRELAATLEKNPASRQFEEEPGLYEEFACERGDSAACRLASAWASRYDDYEDFESDVGCMLGNDGFACEETAAALLEPGQARDLARARIRAGHALELFLAACDHHDGASCLGASRIYALGYVLKRSPARVRELEARACAAGSALGCEQRGDHATGANALALYAKACSADHPLPTACFKLAKTSEALHRPPLEVARRYGRACELRAFDACDWLTRRTPGFTRGTPALKAAFEQWCTSGSVKACEVIRAQTR